MNEKIVAVIATHNRLEKLKKCLSAIECQDVHGIIVVNNCSTDGTMQWLNSLRDQRIKSLHLEKNAGGAGGFRKGCEAALGEFSGANWFLLFDDDAYASKDLIENFNNLTGHCDLICAKVLDPSGKVCRQNRPFFRVPGRINDAASYLFASKRFFANPDSDCFVEAASFVGLFVSRACLEKKIETIMDTFFLYYDDLYFTYSCFKDGFSNRYCNKLIFHHDVHQHIDNMTRMKAFFMARNHLTFLRTFFGAQGFVVYLIWALRKGFFFAVNNKWGLFSAFWNGFQSACLKSR